MGRRHRKGRSNGYQVRGPKGNQQASRLSQHLDRGGQIQEFESRLEQVSHSIPGVPNKQQDYRLDKVWAWKGGLSTGFPGPVKFPLFHGTKEGNVGSIGIRRFRLPDTRGMFGKAVYLTPDLPKALNYTGGSKAAVVLVVEASLGRVRVMEAADKSLDLEEAKKQGFDTAHGKAGKTPSWGGTLAYSEFAVYDTRRILLRYILEYIWVTS